VSPIRDLAPGSSVSKGLSQTLVHLVFPGVSLSLSLSRPPFSIAELYIHLRLLDVYVNLDIWVGDRSDFEFGFVN